jgi:two-component system alkaline phosphatase synthesis response regulator PhoP
MKHTILIIEDDSITVKIMSSILEKHGFSFLTATKGSDALSLLSDEKISAIILDLNLPDVGGLEILKRIRSNPHYGSTAVIIVTNNDDKLDTILGLEMGADDYLTKPFHPRELIARLNSILRRSAPLTNHSNASIIFNELEINLEKRSVIKNKETIDFTFKEFEILKLLASNPGKIITREMILNKIGGEEYTPETRTVDMHIASIRKKIGDTEKHIIDTVSGVGYRFRE